MHYDMDNKSAARATVRASLDHHSITEHSFIEWACQGANIARVEARPFFYNKANSYNIFKESFIVYSIWYWDATLSIC